MSVFDEEYRDIRKVTPTIGVAEVVQTGDFRILEIVSESGLYITWPEYFATRERAEEYVRAMVKAWRRRDE